MHGLGPRQAKDACVDWVSIALFLDFAPGADGVDHMSAEYMVLESIPTQASREQPLMISRIFPRL